MNWNEYKELSEKTEKKFPNGLILPHEVHRKLKQEIEFHINQPMMDALKKEIIYKDHPLDSPIGVRFTQDQIELLHGAMGVFTESVEILEVVWEWIMDGGTIDKLDVVNVQEENADIAWYQAIFSRKLGTDPSKGLDNNIAKLRARYGEAFSNDRANNRDLEVEREILEKR